MVDGGDSTVHDEVLDPDDSISGPVESGTNRYQTGLSNEDGDERDGRQRKTGLIAHDYQRCQSLSLGRRFFRRLTKSISERKDDLTLERS